jgi:hypothetical protein
VYCGCELYANDPGQRLVGLEDKVIATSVKPDGANLSGEVADVCHAGLCIDGKANGLVIVACDQGHVAAGFARRRYRSLVKGVSPGRIAAVCPVHRVGVQVKFQIDGFGKLRPEDLDRTFTDGCVERCAEDPTVVAVCRTLLSPVQQPLLFVDGDADALVAHYSAVGFGGRNHDFVAQVSAIEPHALHRGALPVRPIQSPARPRPRQLLPGDERSDRQDVGTPRAIHLDALQRSVFAIEVEVIVGLGGPTLR